MRKEKKKTVNYRIETYRRAHQHSYVPGTCRDLCDLGIVTYKLDLNK
jgi:hypothetical protein